MVMKDIDIVTGKSFNTVINGSSIVSIQCPFCERWFDTHKENWSEHLLQELIRDRDEHNKGE